MVCTRTNTVLYINYASKQMNKLVEKEIRFVVTTGEEWWEGVLNESDQKI